MGKHCLVTLRRYLEGGVRHARAVAPPVGDFRNCREPPEFCYSDAGHIPHGLVARRFSCRIPVHVPGLEDYGPPSTARHLLPDSTFFALHVGGSVV